LAGSSHPPYRSSLRFRRDLFRINNPLAAFNLDCLHWDNRLSSGSSHTFRFTFKSSFHQVFPLIGLTHCWDNPAVSFLSTVFLSTPLLPTGHSLYAPPSDRSPSLPLTGQTSPTLHEFKPAYRPHRLMVFRLPPISTSLLPPLSSQPTDQTALESRLSLDLLSSLLLPCISFSTRLLGASCPLSRFHHPPACGPTSSFPRHHR